MEDRPDDGSRDRSEQSAEDSSGHRDGGTGGNRGQRGGAHDRGGEHERDGHGRGSHRSASEAGTADSERTVTDAERAPGGVGVPTTRDREFRRRDETTVEERKPDPEPGTHAAAASSRPDGWMGFGYDIGTSVLAVLLVGGFLFAVSGVWPPLVAVESGSMLPNMQKGDLVFVMEEERFPGTGAVDGTGVVTARSGEESGYRRFNGYGDVIVFKPNGSETRTPIIHRAMLYAEEGENWVARANPAFLESGNTVCETDDDPETDTAVQYCPAPYDGFITKGDNQRSNRDYDQVSHLSPPVKPEWVVGTAELRLPGLGWIRLGSQ